MEKIKIHDRKVEGIGGLHCPCCNCFQGKNPIKKAKIALHRRERRKSKQKINKNE